MALTDAELAALLDDIECDRVERKESANDGDKIGQAICAFANDLPGHGKPGVLFIGVKDNGQSANLAVTDQLLQNLASYRDQGHILPPPSMAVRKIVLDGIAIAVVEVEPSNSPPVAYKGRIWVRVGPRRAIANSEDERRLNERRRSLDVPFDARPIPGATIDDLDLQLFEGTILTSLVPPSVLDENGRSIQQRLSSLRFVTADGVPTASGLLTIGKDPLAWLPGAYVQFLRLDGTDLTAPIKDEKRINGTLLELLRQLDEILSLNIATSVDLTSASTEQRAPDYPIAAMQQIARNAIMHRSYENTNSPTRLTWYADRVEFVSPGGPFGIVTADTFGHGLTDYRNPTLAEVMRGLGYVQRFGAGIPIAKSQLAANRNPEPEFIATGSYVSATVRRRS